MIDSSHHFSLSPHSTPAEGEFVSLSAKFSDQETLYIVGVDLSSNVDSGYAAKSVFLTAIRIIEEVVYGHSPSPTLVEHFIEESKLVCGRNGTYRFFKSPELYPEDTDDTAIISIAHRLLGLIGPKTAQQIVSALENQRVVGDDFYVWMPRSGSRKSEIIDPVVNMNALAALTLLEPENSKNRAALLGLISHVERLFSPYYSNHKFVFYLTRLWRRMLDIPDGIRAREPSLDEFHDEVIFQHSHGKIGYKLMDPRRRDLQT